MFRIHPSLEVVPHCHDYDVFVNGMWASLSTARASAVPFNRRWPGHQREIDQTELINFVSLSADEPLTFTVTPKRPFETAVIRPRSLGVTPTEEDGTLTFTVTPPAYFTVEPYGRQNALHVFVDTPDAYEVDPTDENVLYFGTGKHIVDQIELKSNQTLYLDEGAVVYACVTARDAHNIRILGHGILDNSRNREQILFPCAAENNTAAVDNARRQHTVQLEYCTDVLIDGITIRDSLVYNIRPVACRDICIRNVKILGCWRYNSDGIDMHNCENVEIDHCFLRTFDDSVCVKGMDCYYAGDVEAAVYDAIHHDGNVYDRFCHVRVHDCVIWNDWGKALEIGAETRAEEICDVVFEHCDVIHATGQVLDCCNVDYADVHHITYRDITVELDDELPAPVLQGKDGEAYRNPDPDYRPALIAALVQFHPEYSAGGDRRGINRDLLFESVRLYGRHRPRIEMQGHDDTHRVHDVTVRDLSWNDRPVTAEDIDYVDGGHTANIVLK